MDDTWSTITFQQRLELQFVERGRGRIFSRCLVICDRRPSRQTDKTNRSCRGGPTPRMMRARVPPIRADPVSSGRHAGALRGTSIWAVLFTTDGAALSHRQPNGTALGESVRRLSPIVGAESHPQGIGEVDRRLVEEDGRFYIYIYY